MIRGFYVLYDEEKKEIMEPTLGPVESDMKICMTRSGFDEVENGRFSLFHSALEIVPDDVSDSVPFRVTVFDTPLPFVKIGSYNRKEGVPNA